VQKLDRDSPWLIANNFRLPSGTVQLVDTDGSMYSGAEAVLRSLAYGADRRWPLRAYQSVPGFTKCVERIYRLVADHRVFFWRLTRLFGGAEALVIS